MSGKQQKRARRQTPLNWPVGVITGGRLTAPPGLGPTCAACVYWNTHAASEQARLFDTEGLRRTPEGYGRTPFADELGPDGDPTCHIIEVTRNERGGIHYRLLHVVEGGGA